MASCLRTGPAAGRRLPGAGRGAGAGGQMWGVGGKWRGPGHEPVAAAQELARVVPVIGALRAALPETALSIDTTKAEVAGPALDAGADMINDVWGVAAEPELLRLAAARGAPLGLMHNRAEARYANVLP